MTTDFENCYEDEAPSALRHLRKAGHKVRTVSK